MNLPCPIRPFINLITYKILNLGEDSQFGAIVNFFILNGIRILILSLVITFLVTFIRSFFSYNKNKKHISGKYEIVGNILAAFFGIITPFCSILSIPIFLGIIEAGMPLGVAFSYLISAPMTNIVTAIVISNLFGLKISLTYMILGLLIAIVGGFIMGKMNLESLFTRYKNTNGDQALKALGKTSIKLGDRINYSFKYAVGFVKNIYIYALLAIFVAALIDGYIPEALLSQIVESKGLFTIPILVIIGLPLYSYVGAIIPTVELLVGKELARGSVLVFIMSLTALSVPGLIFLKKFMKVKLLAIYILTVAIAIVIAGYLFNFVLPKGVFLNKKIEAVNVIKTVSETNRMQTQSTEKISKIEIVLFYKTTRCWACLTLEKYIYKILAEKFPNEYQNGKIVFLVYDMDLKENRDLLFKYSPKETSIFFNFVIDGKDNINEDIDSWSFLLNEDGYLKYLVEKFKNLQP